MFTTRPLRCMLYLLGILALFLAMTALTSCNRIRKIDAQLWGDTTTTTDPNTGIVTTTRDPSTAIAPPILQTIAAALAAAGFPGMAFWIHRNKKNGTGQLSELTRSLSDLDKRFIAIEARFDAARNAGQS